MPKTNDANANDLILIPVSYQKTQDGVMIQIWRDNNIAIYEETTKGYYEVFEIIIQYPKPKKINGKKFITTYKELLPHNEAFGKYAYATGSKKRAFEIKDALRQRIDNRKN